MAIDYKIIKELAVISESKTVSKRLDIVKWGVNPEKLDLRVWRIKDDGAKVPQKGITLTDAEAQALVDALQLYLGHKRAENRKGGVMPTWKA